MLNSTELKCTQNIKLYYFVHTILSVTFCPIPFCPYAILSIPFCPIPFCPYHFVRYHFVFAPSEALPAQSRTKKTCGQNRHWAAEHFFLFIVNPVFLLISPPPSLSSNPLPVISLNSFSFFSPSPLHFLFLFLLLVLPLHVLLLVLVHDPEILGWVLWRNVGSPRNIIKSYGVQEYEMRTLSNSKSDDCKDRKICIYFLYSEANILKPVSCASVCWLFRTNDTPSFQIRTHDIPTPVFEPGLATPPVFKPDWRLCFEGHRYGVISACLSHVHI